MKRAVLFAILAMSGCAVDDEPEIGVDTAELSSWHLQTFTVTSSGITDITGIAPTANTACFLAGINGNLNSSDLYTEALVDIYPNGDEYEVSMFNNGEHPISITTACVSPAPHKTDELYLTVGSGPVRHTGNAKTHCFLTSIGAAVHGFDDYDDWVAIDRTDNTFTLHGHRTDSSKYMTTRMVCFDATLGEGVWSGGWSAMGGISGPLAADPNGDIACGLTKIGGKFHFNNTTGGINITYDAVQRQWWSSIGDVKQAAFECVK